MTFTKMGSYAGAILAIAAVVGGPIKFFETKAAAAEAKQQVVKTVNELRAEMYLKEIAEIDAKPEPTKADLTRRELLVGLVKQIQAESVVKK